VDTLLEDNIEIKLWLAVIFAVRGLRISEAGPVSAICLFLHFLDAVIELKPDMRSAGTDTSEGFISTGIGYYGLFKTHPICNCWPG
jgi:hypothetical protein